MTFPQREVIKVRGIENMLAVEQGWSVIHVRIVAVGINAGLILVGDILVEGFREGITGLPSQSMRGPLAQRNNHSVVIRLSDVGPHVQVEHLAILVGRQSETS